MRTDVLRRVRWGNVALAAAAATVLAAVVAWPRLAPAPPALPPDAATPLVTGPAKTRAQGGAKTRPRGRARTRATERPRTRARRATTHRAKPRGPRRPAKTRGPTRPSPPAPARSPPRVVATPRAPAAGEFSFERGG